MRIGSNHGSLSDRILNRFGDTPEVMVEIAIEFAQISRDLDYHSPVSYTQLCAPSSTIRISLLPLERAGC